jgi:hypothetical protein
LLGPLFGLKALGEMRTDPRVSGRRLALTGIVVGTIATAAWGGVAVWWHINARRPMLNGPHEALAAGFAGDLDGFRDGFCCEAAQASEAEAFVFLAELSRRYGLFQGIRQVASGDDVQQPTGAGMRRRIAYLLDFERGSVPAEAEFVVISEDDAGLQLRFGSLWVLDDNAGVLSYPRSVGDRSQRPGGATDPDSLPEASPGPAP